MTQLSISQFDKPKDSISLAKLGNEVFDIVAIESSSFEKDGKTDPGYKITMKKSYNIDGKDVKKFHTTRRAIVAFLNQEEITTALDKGNSIGPIKCEKVKAKTPGVNDYWMLVDA